MILGAIDPDAHRAVRENIPPPGYDVEIDRFGWVWQASLNRRGIGYSTRRQACVAAWNDFDEHDRTPGSCP